MTSPSDSAGHFTQIADPYAAAREAQDRANLSSVSEAMRATVENEVSRRYAAEDAVTALAKHLGMATVAVTWPGDVDFGSPLAYDLAEPWREHRWRRLVHNLVAHPTTQPCPRCVAERKELAK